MCRIAAYLGPPTPLSGLLGGSLHGLLHQSYAPRRMTVGRLNADGWGVGWFVGESGKPGLLRGKQPIWSDENAETATGAIEAGVILGSVRGASPGLGISVANTMPFMGEGCLFAHNGLIKPWAGPLARALRSRLSLAAEAALRGTTDSEVFFGLVQDRVRDGVEVGRALTDVIGTISVAAEAAGGGFSANAIWADKSSIVAARWARPEPAPSLFLLRHDDRWREGVLIASEPLDDSPGLREIPAGTLLRIDASGIKVESMAI